MYIYFHRHDGRHQHCPPVQKHDAVITQSYFYLLQLLLQTAEFNTEGEWSGTHQYLFSNLL
jgi:hypothetical protein